MRKSLSGCRAYNHCHWKRFLTRNAKAPAGLNAPEKERRRRSVSAGYWQGKSQMDNYYVTNILILGKTGAGKSTLVNYLYGREIAVAKAGRPETPKGIHRHDPFPYKNMNIVIWDSWGLEPDKAEEWQERLKEDLIRQSGQPNIRDWIHTVIYCYDAKKSRLESYEVEHILKPLIGMGYRVIFALTKWGLCSPEEKEAAKRVLKETYPDFHAIPVESISQKLRGGKTTYPEGREDLFREICLNLRRSLMYHLRIRTRNEMEEALNRAENAALAYYDKNTSYFTIHDDALMKKIQNFARESYESSIKEVYDRLRNNITLIDSMCVAVIRDYTGIDVSEKLKRLHVIMSSIKDARITAWTGDGTEYFARFVSTIITIGLGFISRKSCYREELEKELGKLSRKLKEELESFADTLDKEDIEVDKEIAAELNQDPDRKKTEENKGNAPEPDPNDTAPRIVIIKGVPTELRLISPAVRN